MGLFDKLKKSADKTEEKVVETAKVAEKKVETAAKAVAEKSEDALKKAQEATKAKTQAAAEAAAQTAKRLAAEKKVEEKMAAEAAAKKEAEVKKIDDLATEVIRGNWGNGQERYDKLTAAGYDYDAVQKRVNEMLSGKAPAAAAGGKSIDELAREVIRGNWGNGQERYDRLTAAGYDYNAVQKRVNELLK